MGIFRPRWLDLVLLAALASLVFYVQIAPVAPSNSPWISLWPNAVVDLFSIWLTLRVVQGILDQNQKRRTVYNVFRSGLNFLAGQLRDLMPHVDGFKMRIVEDELRAFKLRLDRQGKYLREEHRATAQAAFDRASAIVAPAGEFQSLRREMKRRERRMRVEFDRSREVVPDTAWFHNLLWLRDIPTDVGELGNDPDDATEFVGRVDQARKMVVGVAGTEELRRDIESYLTSVQGIIGRHYAIVREVESYAKFVREYEISLLDAIDA